MEEVMSSPALIGPLARLMVCPPTGCGAAVIVCSEEFARANGLAHRVKIVARFMTTDTPSTFEARSMIQLVGGYMTSAAATQVYTVAGIGPKDVNVVELHDCFATNEPLTYEAFELEIAPEGGGEKMVADCDNTYGCRVVTDPQVACCQKDTFFEPLVWLNAPSWFSNSGEKQALAKCMAPGWPHNTTWGWAGPALSRSTKPEVRTND
ncbi:hypothetical protein AQB9606_03135 [Aquabacterium sp. CECT 9606]|nr:hypothetical protein AQB9606_03135 [Aquabacterium sp. CECT 9606]